MDTNSVIRHMDTHAIMQNTLLTTLELCGFAYIVKTNAKVDTYINEQNVWVFTAMISMVYFGVEYYNAKYHPITPISDIPPLSLYERVLTTALNLSIFGGLTTFAIFQTNSLLVQYLYYLICCFWSGYLYGWGSHLLESWNELQIP